MNFAIINGAQGTGLMTWEKPQDIRGNVWLSMNIKKGSLFTDKNFGLDLTDIDKITENNIEKIQKRIEQALNWLLVTEKARAISVEIDRDNLNISRLNIRIEVIQSDSVPIVITNFIEVGV